MYLLFAGDDYYPVGGFDDLVGSFDCIEDARSKGEGYEWWHIVRITTNGFEIVEKHPDNLY